MKISYIKPKLQFPAELEAAPAIKSTELIEKSATIKMAVPYVKEGEQKVALLLEVGGKPFALYTGSKAIVDVGLAIATLNDFDGAKVKFVQKSSKTGKSYIDVEDA